MADKFDNPSQATGACSDFNPDWADCVGTGTLNSCTILCGGERATSKRAFRRASGTPQPCGQWVRNCTAVGESPADCLDKCNQRPVDGRTIRVTPPSANARFMMATGRGKAMSDFLHEVGIIVIGFAAFTYIAQPIFKKVGIKPINI